MSVVEHLFKKYDENFSLEVPRLDILEEGIQVLWGPSGAGKTSILRILLGLEACSGYRWTWGSEIISAMGPAERRIGVVFQNQQLFPHMTSIQNIFFPVEARKIDRKKADERFSVLVDTLHLSDFLNRSASLISGGERQRVAIARALMSFPRILFLDEPFSNLDEDLKQDARSLVKTTVEQMKIPALLVTHDLKDREFLGSKITEIKNGRVFDPLKK